MSATWIEIPQWGPATLIDLTLLAAGLFALALTGKHLPTLHAEYVRSLDANGRVRIVARRNLRLEAVRFIVGALISSLGLYAAWLPPALPGPARVTPLGLLFAIVLLLVSFSTALMSWWDWRDREALHRAARAPT